MGFGDMLRNAGEGIIDAAPRLLKGVAQAYPAAYYAGRTGDVRGAQQMNQQRWRQMQMAAMQRELEQLGDLTPETFPKASAIIGRYGTPDDVARFSSMVLRHEDQQFRRERAIAQDDLAREKFDADEAWRDSSLGLKRQELDIMRRQKTSGYEASRRSAFDEAMAETGGNTQLSRLYADGKAFRDPRFNQIVPGTQTQAEDMRIASEAITLLGTLDKEMQQLTAERGSMGRFEYYGEVGEGVAQGMMDKEIAGYEQIAGQLVGKLTRTLYGGNASEKDRAQTESMIPKPYEIARDGQVSGTAREKMDSLQRQAIEKYVEFLPKDKRTQVRSALEAEMQNIAEEARVLAERARAQISADAQSADSAFGSGSGATDDPIRF